MNYMLNALCSTSEICPDILHHAFRSSDICSLPPDMSRPLNNLPDPLLKRLDHLIRDLWRRRLAQRRIQRIRKLILNRKIHLRLLLSWQWVRRLNILPIRGLMQGVVWRRLVGVGFQRPAREEGGHDAEVLGRVLIRCRARVVV